jgi:4-amino-4-deoxy-L-arabinose transferase-like glycosyltransferase
MKRPPPDRQPPAPGAATRSPWLVPVLFVIAGAVVQFFHRDPILHTVETDFVSHAASAATWRTVFTLNGLLPFGYPLVLRLATLLTSDPFVAARIIAVLAAGLSLRVAHGLVRDFAAAETAFTGQVYLALNWYFYETALLVGTDQLASLLAVLAVRSLATTLRESTARRALVGGAWAGAAALVRQTALVLLPAFLIAVSWNGLRRRERRRSLGLAALAVAGGLIVYAPQMMISWRATGELFHQTQAKNVWFGLHGGMDWSQWPKDRDLSLTAIVRSEPQLFFSHWAKETVLGGIRLVSMTAGVFPPYLARRVGGVVPVVLAALTGLATLATLVSVRARRVRDLTRLLAPPDGATAFLLLLVLGWTTAVGLAFSTSRFLLTPWIVSAFAAVTCFRIVCRPAGGGRDLRSAIAESAWVVTLLANAGCAIYFTYRLGA